MGVALGRILGNVEGIDEGNALGKKEENNVGGDDG